MSSTRVTWLPPESGPPAEPSEPPPDPGDDSPRAPAHLSLWLALAGALLMAAIVVFGAGGPLAPVGGGIAFVCFVLAVYLNMPGVRSDGSFDASSSDQDRKPTG